MFATSHDFSKRTRLLPVLILLVISNLAFAQKGKKPPKDDPPTAAPPRYQLNLLGTLGGPSSQARSINERGDVLGISHTADGRPGPFVYFKDSATMWNVLDLVQPSDQELWDWRWFSPLDINSSCQICGGAKKLGDIERDYSVRVTLAFDSDGVVIPEAGVVEVVEPDGASESGAASINEWGDVAGWYDVGDVRRAFVYTDSFGGEDIGDLGGGTSVATAINNYGEVAGSSHDADGNKRAFRFIPGVGMQDLGIIRKPRSNIYNSSSSRHINDNGIVVGSSVAGTIQGTNTVFHAFRESGTGMEDLGVLENDTDSTAWGINSSGTIVGLSFPGTHLDRSFLYHDDYGMVPLDSLIENFPANWRAWVVEGSINDAGEICGRMVDENGTILEAFLLTPIEP